MKTQAERKDADALRKRVADHAGPKDGKLLAILNTIPDASLAKLHNILTASDKA